MAVLLLTCSKLLEIFWETNPKSLGYGFNNINLEKLIILIPESSIKKENCGELG